MAIASYHPKYSHVFFFLPWYQPGGGVPFPVVVEVLLMELAFELLREAGIRLPGQLGGTIGVVGGLIVGQAAVDAHLVSTIVVIVVALTAIATFAIPNEVFTGAFRLLKFFLIFMCAFWGLYGFFLGFLAIFIHLFAGKLRSPTCIHHWQTCGEQWHFRMMSSGHHGDPDPAAEIYQKECKKRQKGEKS